MAKKNFVTYANGKAGVPEIYSLLIFIQGLMKDLLLPYRKGRSIKEFANAAASRTYHCNSIIDNLSYFKIKRN
jgi:hypothetical protein